MRASDVRRRVLDSVEAGARFLMLRDHAATHEPFEKATSQLLGLLQERDGLAVVVNVVVNTRVDTATAERAGLHVGSRGPALASMRRRFSLLGFSAHTPEEAEQAARDGADYIVFSPIFPTDSKAGHPGAGLEALALAVHAASSVPVYALGGVTPDRVRPCLEAGAYGVAVLSGILDAPSPAVATRSYQSALDLYA